MCPTAESQPNAAEMPVGEFDARTWRKDELIAFAKALSIPTKGTKAELGDRIRITLIRRSITTAVEVHTGVTVGGAPMEDLPRTGTSAPPAPRADDRLSRGVADTDFFRETPHESRAKGLAEWFARRTARRNGKDD